MISFKQLISAAASAVLLITAGVPAAASAAVRPDKAAIASKVSALGSFPDWVPDNYLEALEFSNSRGATYVEGEYICVVQQRPLHKDDLFYDILCSGKSVENHELTRVFAKDMEFSPSDAPSDSGTEAYADYMKRLRAAGIKENAEELDNYFRVEVYTTKYQDLDITIREGYYSDGGILNVTSSRTFTFGYYNSPFEKEQFDLFRFLPDCIEEYDAFIKEHGNICAYNDLIIFCGDVRRSAGEQYFMEQHGIGRVKQLLSYDVEYRSPVMFGTPVDTLPLQRAVRVYEPVQEGEVYVDFAVSRNVRPNDEDIDARCFTIKTDSSQKMRVVENKIDLPEWVPKDLGAALEFDNKYGATHVEDGYICCVRRMDNYGKGYTERTYMTDYADDSSYDCHVYSRVFRLPEAVSSGEEGYDEYIAALGELGIRERDIKYAKTDICFSVDVFKPKPSSGVTVYWNKKVKYGSNYPNEYALKFTADENGDIRETDLFGWLPDCLPEAQDYIKNAGNISVHGEYVIFCSVGRSFRIDPTQEGISEVKKYCGYYIEPANIIDVIGGMYGEVTVFEPLRPGTVTVDFHYSGGSDIYEPQDGAVCSFRFDNDLNASIISSSECDKPVPGDCNSDGAVGVSDLVALQRWLLGREEQINHENADMNKDNVIDSFDLVSLKKLLIKGGKKCCGIVSDPEPVLAIIYENHAWSTQQQITVYDENGVGYNMYYYTGQGNAEKNTYSKLIRMYDADGSWYDAIKAVMADENALRTCMADNIVESTRMMSLNLSAHKDDEMGTCIGKMFDAGQSTIFLIGKDTDGSPLQLPVYSDGDCLEWTDCEEIQAYLKSVCYSLPTVDIDSIHELEEYSNR
ncbi:MAG: dockerin type I repeat-containing protein [Ruminococcus sp.]|nr:dockerin type I repeat-containing protein [Ruminococcus sp.]